VFLSLLLGAKAGRRLSDATRQRVRPLFLVACVGRIMDAANTRKKEALGASVMRRSATSNLTPNSWDAPHVKGCFDRAVLLVVSLDKGEFHALIPKGARLASRLGSTRDIMAAFFALDGWGSLYSFLGQLIAFLRR